ncbi:MAG TPA: hypothetical protein VJU61_05355 [Polyangiaceae bacterium]|nr:hypothetical protein [Polyangiaceae bacterium]
MAEPDDQPKADPEAIKDRNKRVREEAAARRRNKREAETRRAAPARNLDTSEIVDDALARTTHAASVWLKRHLNTLQYVVLALIVGGIGYQIYSYRRGMTAAHLTDELHKAVGAQHARIGQGAVEPDQYTLLGDPRPVFADEPARLKAAAEEYKKVESSGSATTSALASLGLAGVLFDQGKYADAKAEYQKVKSSSLAERDPDVRARALEGIGLAEEAADHIDPALAAFRELGNLDVPGFAALGEYHQARLLVKKEQREQAKPLLVKALSRLTESKDKDAAKSRAAGGTLLERQVKELLSTIDPSAVPKEAPGGMTMEQLDQLKAQIKVGADGQLDPKQMQQLLEKIRSRQPAPSPAPAGSGK